MSACACASVASALATAPSPTNGGFLYRSHPNSKKCIFTFNPFANSSSSSHHHHHHHHSPFTLRVTNDSTTSTELSIQNQKSEADKIVDGMDFGELCNEFECISSPLVESTARQLVRDILELREGNRALGTFAVSVKYKTVQEMVMLSTSVLSIKWTLRGKPKSIIANIGGDLTVKVHSKFTLNQISGQVIEHEELWDLSASSPVAQAFFWASHRLYATTEAGKDSLDLINNFKSKISTEQENLGIYPDPSGDPTKFFQRDDGFQKDLYQIALFLAVLYFVVQFLRTTL
ncbi:transmembrane protein [Citrus sinensis]|uniref:AT1G65230-like protein n=1 Tax=Citrus clementina TaxID=85681 RepID=V4S398_CITCL|nr:hypothetical protein CICLE_v10013335mg [Citrus x clementina]KAH9670736.1 transmembrane protein [Citrus sinensis]